MILFHWQRGSGAYEGETLIDHTVQGYAELKRRMAEPVIAQHPPTQGGEGAIEELNPGDPGHLKAVIERLPGYFGV